MSIFNERFSDIMLRHDKRYQKHIDSFNDGTVKAEMLKKSSEMAKNCERYDKFTERYMQAGKILIVVTVVHLLLIINAIFGADFILYFFILAALAMQWYALYTKKTAFAYLSPVSVSIGIMTDVLLKLYSTLIYWGILMALFSIFMIAVIHPLNIEYLYLSKQEGFPHFKYILDEEIEKNKKALAGKLDLYYANLTAPEGKLGDMDDLDLPLEPIEARPDGRNDYMDSV